MCIRDMEADHRQRGGRSREQVMGQGKRSFSGLRPALQAGGKGPDTCSGSSSSRRCSGWGGHTQASRLQPGAPLASDAFLPRPGTLDPSMPPPADPAP